VRPEMPDLLQESWQREVDIEVDGQYWFIYCTQQSVHTRINVQWWYKNSSSAKVFKYLIISKYGIEAFSFIPFKVIL